MVTVTDFMSIVLAIKFQISVVTVRFHFYTLIHRITIVYLTFWNYSNYVFDLNFEGTRVPILLKRKYFLKFL